MELKPPKPRKPSPRKMREFERENEAEAEKVKRTIEARYGSVEAFEQARREIAEKLGAKYGAPEVHPKKRFVHGRYFEAEAKLKDLEVIGNAVPVPGGVLLLPNGIMKAAVAIPSKFRRAFQLTPHSTSTFARLGIDIGQGQEEFARQLQSKNLGSKMGVYLHNWSHLPVLVRAGDPCRLLNTPELFGRTAPALSTLPRTKSAHGFMAQLHAGDHVIKVSEEQLPKMRFGQRELSYVDPRAPNLKQLFQPHPFKRIETKPGDFIVISTRERMRVPADNIAIVHSARDDLAHTSAVLAHPGWEGILALEFKALEHGVIKPGDHLAWLSTHAPLEPPARKYAGRYQAQETAAPQAKRKEEKK